MLIHRKKEGRIINLENVTCMMTNERIRIVFYFNTENIDSLHLYFDSQHEKENAVNDILIAYGRGEKVLNL